MPPGEPFEMILQTIAAPGCYTIGDLLMDLFCKTGRSSRYGRMLGSRVENGGKLWRRKMLGAELDVTQKEHKHR